MKDREPNIAKRGVLLEEHDPHDAIRRVAESAKWEYRDEAVKLYRRADTIIERFYPVIHTPHFEGKLPPVLIAINTERNKKVLASYRLVPDEYGLSFKINMNEQHYIKKDGKKVWRYGEWAQMETLVHEIGHHWQQMLGENPYKQGARVTHNKEFTDKMDQLGIHCATEGYHTKIADVDSPFGQLMKEWGIKPPEVKPEAEFDIHWWREHFKDREKKGRSTLQKWCCANCGAPVRWGRQEDPQIRHHKCEQETGEEPIFFVPGVIYDASKK